MLKYFAIISANFCKVEGKIPHLRAIDSPVFLKDIEEKYFPCDDSWYRYRALGTCRVKTGKMEFSGCKFCDSNYVYIVLDFPDIV